MRLDLITIRKALRTKIITATGPVGTYTGTGALAFTLPTATYTDASAPFAGLVITPGVNDHLQITSPAGVAGVYHIASVLSATQLQLDAWTSTVNTAYSGTANATNALNLLNANQWAWQGENAVPPDASATALYTRNTMWVQETLLPGDETQSSNNLYETLGIYQLNIFCAKGRGLVEIEALARVLVDCWKAPKGLATGDANTQLSIDKATRSNIIGRPDGLDMLPVRVYWRAYVPKDL